MSEIQSYVHVLQQKIKVKGKRILERTYMKCFSFDVGGLSAEVGEEKWTSTVVGDRSLHNESGVVGM
jgi:hypothetical protein